jgi:competence protein ComEC
VPALRATGTRQLDLLVISHADNDHAGGLPVIRRHFPAAQVHASTGAVATDHRPCRAGDGWQWDGVHFQYLWPGSQATGSDNDRSCVLQISLGARRVLLTGDIGAGVETALVEAHGAALRSDVLVAPHHGSRSSSSENFIQQVQPGLVLVSSGYRNRFGHPHPEILGRYQRHGAQVANSADTGWAELMLTPAGWHWRHRERLDNARYWQRAVTDAAISED